jgi:hypothetical protein
VFDVFGTVVDWRSGVIRDSEKLDEAKGLDVEWTVFADAWREEYQSSGENGTDTLHSNAMIRRSLLCDFDRVFKCDDRTERVHSE